MALASPVEVDVASGMPYGESPEARLVEFGRASDS